MHTLMIQELAPAGDFEGDREKENVNVETAETVVKKPKKKRRRKRQKY